MVAQKTMPSVDRLARRMRQLHEDATATNPLASEGARMLIRRRAAGITDDARSLATISGPDARETLKQIETDAARIRDRFSRR